MRNNYLFYRSPIKPVAEFLFTMVCLFFLTLPLFVQAQCNESQMEDKKEWSAWSPSGTHGLHFRVDYSYYNKLIAKDGGKAHIWSYEIKNITTEEIKFKYDLTGYGAPPNLRLTTLKGGEVMFRTAFTNAHCGDVVKVWIEAAEQPKTEKSQNSSGNSNTQTSGEKKQKDSELIDEYLGKSNNISNNSNNRTSTSSYSNGSSGNQNNSKQQQTIDNYNKQQGDYNQKQTQNIYGIQNSIDDAFDKVLDNMENKTRSNASEPAGGTKVNCSSCKGNGSTECTWCLGKGGKNCMVCSGKGENRCPWCSGTGRVGNAYVNQTCSQCGGRKTLSCNSCRGTGFSKCTTCRGKGSKFCYRCSGKGYTVTH